MAKLTESSSAEVKEIVTDPETSDEPKHFVEIQLHPPIQLNLDPPQYPTEIIFKRVPGRPLNLNDDESKFLRKVEVAALRVSDTIRDPESRTHVLMYLLSAARLGLGGKYPQLKEGSSSFEGFKLHVVRAAEKERREFIRDVWKESRAFLAVSFVSIIVWLIITEGTWGNKFINLDIVKSTIGVEWINAFSSMIGVSGFALLGVIVGNMFVVFLRGKDMNFENFDQLSKYRFLPDMHLKYLFLVTFVVLLLLYYDVIMIGVGSILLNDFVEKIPLAVVIGLVCSLSEAIIVGIVVQKTKPTFEQSNNNTIERHDNDISEQHDNDTTERSALSD